jgi:antirestriction protein ArdC
MGNKVYDIVTEKILKALDAGVVPWFRPWNTLACRNAFSKHQYSGINAILLDVAGRGAGWLTAKQIIQLGGDFTGVKSEFITFFSPVQKKKKSANEPAERFFLMRGYLVFPVSEIKNLPQKYYDANATAVVAEHHPVEEAEQIIADFLARTGVVMKFGGNEACYIPSMDEIHIPERNTFVSIEEYYCAVFHEIMHSTQKRCNVVDSYAENELRAEIGASMLLAQVGLDNTAVIKNASAYCKGWASRIRGEQNTLVTRSASKAYSGVDFVLNTAPAEVEVEEVAVV